MRNRISAARNKAYIFAAGFSALASSGFVMADDPTTGILTTLGTYGTDVGLLAAAVLLIFYGKKLVSYLKV
jgi:cytochrome c biogenesis protein CcdA